MYLNDSKTFIEYSNNMDNIHENIEEENPNTKQKILIVLHHMIADMISNKKLNSIVNELFTRGRKLNISLVFITRPYFKVSKDVRLNTTHFSILKIPNKRELQQIPCNHSSDIDIKESLSIFTKTYCKTIFFLVIDATLSFQKESFRKNIRTNHDN